MTHLLVTNDFPPKVGGIQSYLWELWRRLPPEEFAVLTTAHDGARAFDAQQPFRIERVAQRVLLPRRRLVRRIDRLAAEIDAAFVLLDPPCRWAWSAAGSSGRTASSCTAPRSRCPEGFLVRPRCSGACCAGPVT